MVGSVPVFDWATYLMCLFEMLGGINILILRNILASRTWPWRWFDVPLRSVQKETLLAGPCESWDRCLKIKGSKNKKIIRTRFGGLNPTWIEHATFWSGVRRATIGPRIQLVTTCRNYLFHRLNCNWPWARRMMQICNAFLFRILLRRGQIIK